MDLTAPGHAGTAPAMDAFRILVPATTANYSEAGYLAANPDVAAAVRAGTCPDGRTHFEAFGMAEGRHLRLPVPPERKAAKLARVRPLLAPGVQARETATLIDCLTDAQRAAFGIVHTDNVSAHEYDHVAMEVIARHAGGLVLDCGAGLRHTDYAHVVNYEIVPYDSTDVLGVAEQLPFADATFDAVLSLNVLEHVKDPFQAAREIMRVLKPGGELFAVAPFLQPLHGYPHHYYNMTAQGLEALFEPLQDKRILRYGAMHPAFTLNWIIADYARGLDASARDAFLGMRVGALLEAPEQLLAAEFATSLADAQREALAAANGLLARRP